MRTEIIALFAVLAIIVLGLSIYLGNLYSRLRSQRATLDKALKQANLAWEERDKDIRSSLRTLALVIIQEQCEPTEGCIRIKKLVDEIESLKDRDELSVFHDMYEEVKEFAILQDYKDLSAQEKFRQDNKRFAIEEKYAARLKKGSENLRALLDNPPTH